MHRLQQWLSIHPSPTLIHLEYSLAQPRRFLRVASVKAKVRGEKFRPIPHVVQEKFRSPRSTAHPLTKAGLGQGPFTIRKITNLDNKKFPHCRFCRLEITDVSVHIESFGQTVSELHPACLERTDIAYTSFDVPRLLAMARNKPGRVVFLERRDGVSGLHEKICDSEAQLAVVEAEQRQADEIRRELRDPRIAHFISWTETEQLQTYLLDMRGREVALDVLRRVRERVSNRSRSERNRRRPMLPGTPLFPAPAAKIRPSYR
eukprot:g2022.t1